MVQGYKDSYFILSSQAINPYNDYDYMGFTLKEIQYADMIHFTFYDNNIRYWFNGATVTPSTGFFISSDTDVRFFGTELIKNLSLISESGQVGVFATLVSYDIPIFDSQRNYTNLLDEQFITSEASPLASPRVSEPSANTVALTENDGTFFISSGSLNYTAQSTPVNGDLQYLSDSLVMEDAIAIVFENISSDFGGAGQIGEYIGLTNLLIGSSSQPSLLFTGLSGGVSGYISYYPVNIVFFNNPLDYVDSGDDIYMICDNNKVSVYRRTGDDIKLLIVFDDSSLSVTPKLFYSNRNGTGSVDRIRVVTMPNDIYYSDTISSATPKETDVLSSNSDFVCNMTMNTLPTSGNYILSFRIIDESNYMTLEFVDDGAVVLYEVVNGIKSSLSSSSSGVVSNSDKVIVICEDTSIVVYVNSSEAIDYRTLSNHLSGNNLEFSSDGDSNDGVITLFSIRPRFTTGELKTFFNNMVQ